MSDKENFFNKLKNEEHRGFEITMFSVSVCVAVVMLISVIMLLVYWHKANADKISDEEVNATNVAVTEAAVTVTEKPNEVTTGSAVVTENDFDEDDDVDDELKEATYAYTTTKVNMRNDGSLTADVVTKVPAGKKVKIIELTEDHKWMKVTYNGETGYISVMYLTTTKPVATATPAAETTAPQRTVAPSTTTATPRATKTPKPVKTAKPTKPTKKPKVTKEPEEEPEETEIPATAAPTEVPATAVPTEKPKPTAAPTEVPATAVPTDEESGE